MLVALEAKASELAATQERARLELQEQWEQYRSIYEKVCSMHQVRGCVAGYATRACVCGSHSVLFIVGLLGMHKQTTSLHLSCAHVSLTIPWMLLCFSCTAAC
jgi:hypothetical protein